MQIHSFQASDQILPSSLWQIPSPSPESLYVRGRADALELLERLPEAGLAIVGTRAPLPRNQHLVRRSVRAIRDSGLVIVSGLARGIDAAAHEAALEVGMPTIGVLACGLDQVYPRSHFELAERILNAGGLLISEHAEGVTAYPSQFLARNRLIAAWTRATWMVEAAERSGALNTAAHANRFGKDLYVTPSFPGDVAMMGNVTLLDEGAAYPFWGPHSLGATWLGLSSAGKTTALTSIPGQNASDAAYLAHWVTRKLARGGGVTRPDLQDQLAGEGWPPGRLHLAVDAACERGWLAEELGLIFRPGAQ